MTEDFPVFQKLLEKLVSKICLGETKFEKFDDSL